MNELSKTIKSAGVYAIGVILNRAVSFVMLPIYTRVLTPADYGTLELLYLTTDIFSLFFGVGIAAGIFRFYSMYNNQEDQNAVISTASLLLIGFFFVASSLGGVFSEKLSILVFGTNQNTYFFKLAFIILFFQAFIEVPLLYIKAIQKPFLFVGVNIFKLLLLLSLNIYLVVIQDLHVLGALYSTLIGTCFVGILLLVFTYKKIGMTFCWKLARSMIVFGSPLVISNLGAFVYTFSDRYFLKIYAGVSDVGIYSLAYKFGFLLWALVASPIFSTWNPRRFEIVKNTDLHEINKKVFLLLNLILITVALFISLFSRDIFRVMSSPEFWGAYKIVPLILIAYIIQSWIAFGNFGIFYKAKTKYMAMANSASAVLTIILCFLLIPWLKGYGAALATILAFLVRWIIVYYYSQRLFKIEVPWAKCISILLIGVTIYVVNLLIEFNSLILSIGKSLILFISFLILLYLLPVFNKEEKKSAINFVFDKLRNLRSIHKVTSSA